MKQLVQILTLTLLLTIISVTIPINSTFAQGELACERDVVTQADDWLSKLAEKFYGDPLGFQAIVEATNAKAATDNSYTAIANPDIVEAGWKLCVPSKADAEAILGNAPQPGGTLKLALVANVRTMNPTATRSLIHNLAWAHFYEPLLKPGGGPFNDRGGFEPLLAESWEVADDGLSITFNLRQGVTFHDGTPFNAEAAKFNFEYRMNPDNSAVTRADFAKVARIEAADENTLVIHFTSPDPSFLSAIAYTNNAMISPSAIQELGEDLGLQAVGTGPFVLQQFEPEGETIGLRNENYWNPQYPYLDQVVIVGIPESSTRTLALESGEVDVVANVLWSDVPSLREKGFQFEIAPPGLSTSLVMNPNQPPLDEIAVRKAIALGVDREAVLEAAFNGEGLPNKTGVLPQSWGYCEEAADMAYAYNPEQAVTLLEEGGWIDSDGDGVREKNGQKLAFQFIIPPWDADPILGEIVQAQLSEIGIDAQASTAEAQVLFAKLADGDYGMSHWGLLPRSLDPHEIFQNFHSESGENRFQYRNAEMDAMIEQAVALTDQAARAEIYCDIQKKIIEDVATAWMIHESYYAFGYPPSIKGITQAYYRIYDPRLIWKSAE